MAKLGKNYNAESAWNYLGTDRSSYDKSYLSGIVSNFREIASPGFTEYKTTGPRQSPAYEQGVMRGVYNTYNNANTKTKMSAPFLDDINQATYGLLSDINQLPQALNNAALAGKYRNLKF